jgi:hypothetical protein
VEERCDGSIARADRAMIMVQRPFSVAAGLPKKLPDRGTLL